MANTTYQGWSKPTVGGSSDTWGATLNTTIDAIDALVGSVTAAEIATLDGLTASTAEINTLDGLTASTAEINTLDGLTASTAEINYVTGVTSSIQTQIDNAVPSGVIFLWSGSQAAIPSGFVICDGTNSTPNLRNRFVVGAGSAYAVGATGGSANAVIVSHTHTATVTDAGHSHSTQKAVQGDGSDGWGDGNIDTGGAYPHISTANSGTTASATTGVTVANSTEGVSGTNANLPPYYSLCYIMKT